MKLTGLTFDSMPSLDIPFRFFLTAPLFIIIGAAILLFAPIADLASRWSNLVLALTHSITLGFMLMVMLGSLFQILPVVTGANLPKADKLARLVYLFLVSGTVGLLTGFIYSIDWLLTLAGCILFLCIAIFISGILVGTSRMRWTPTSRSIQLAAFSLLITVCLGFFFVIAWISPNWFPAFRLWTNIHLLWGLAGWVLLLVMAVSFQVIPMFYVTPEYPHWLKNYLPPFIFILLVLLTSLNFLEHSSFVGITKKFLSAILYLMFLVYGFSTLHLLSRRKRKSKDPTIQFWNTAMLSVSIASILLLLTLVYSGEYLTQIELAILAFVIFGGIIGLITGMMLKIVPFLIWLNLQQAWIKLPSKKMPLSNMHQVISAVQSKRQYQLFLIAFLTILIAPFASETGWLIKLIALLSIFCYSHLLFVLIKAGKLYQLLSNRMKNEPDNEKYRKKVC